MKPYQQQIQALHQRLSRHQGQTISGDYPQAAVLVALSRYQDELALLLTRRAMHLKLHPGEAAFPGGKFDPGDGMLLSTALREAQEEVALEPAAFGFIGCLDQQLTRSQIKVSPFVGLIPAGSPLSPNFDELDCLYHVPLSFVAGQGNLHWDKVEYEGQLRYVPCFDYEDSQHGPQYIWGVTAKIIVDLMNTVFDSGLDTPEA